MGHVTQTGQLEYSKCFQRGFRCTGNTGSIAKILVFSGGTVPRTRWDLGKRVTEKLGPFPRSVFRKQDVEVDLITTAYSMVRIRARNPVTRPSHDIDTAPS